MTDRRDESRTQGVAKGWIKESIQIPVQISDNLSIASQREGHGSKKILCTIAIALMLGLPDDIRKRLYDYIIVRARAPYGIDPDDLWKELVSVIAEEPDVVYYVSRILDPEVTPEPGEKASDQSCEGRKTA